MKQIKLFGEACGHEYFLDKKINKFLADQNIQVDDIQFQVTDHRINVMVVYHTADDQLNVAN